MPNIKRLAFISVITSAFVSTFNFSLAAPVKTDLEATKESEDAVVGFVNSKLPSQIQLTYAEEKNTNKNALGVKYSFISRHAPKIKDIKDAYNDKKLNIGSHGHELFAKGDYFFSSKNDRPDSLSEIGASYNKRWFTLNYTKLSDKQSQEKQECMLAAGDFNSDVICTKRLNLPREEVSHFYADVNGHIKAEGNQDYSQRNLVHGFEFNVSGMPKTSSWVHYLNILEYPSRLLRKKEPDVNYRQLPILTLGLEQVDPKKDDVRSNVGVSIENYNRYYAQIRHTSPFGEIDGNPVKLSFNWRYFKEINAPDLIKQAGLQQSNYYVIALQLPTAIVPNLKTEKSNFIISYSAGKLPFGRKDEEIFEIGWRSDVDLSDVLSP